MADVYIKKGEGRSFKSGGMWFYDNEIDRIEGKFENGDIIDVLDFDGYYLGRGFINTNSKITIRILTRHKDVNIDREFIKKRVKDAVKYRLDTVDTSSCRLIFGEADYLPGIVIDKFSDILVVESLALGIDRLKADIIECLKEELASHGMNIRGVYERSDAKVRLNEGMERVKGFIGEPFDTKVEIVENGVKYMVNVADGQKTGFFLDQKYNRQAVAKLAKGNITGLQWEDCVKVPKCLTVLPIQVLLHLMRLHQEPKVSSVWMHRSLELSRQKKMPFLTMFRTKQNLYAGMYLNCFLNWWKRASSMMWLFLTLLHLPNPVTPLKMPPKATGKLILKA